MDKRTLDNIVERFHKEEKEVRDELTFQYEENLDALLDLESEIAGGIDHGYLYVDHAYYIQKQAELSLKINRFEEIESYMERALDVVYAVWREEKRDD